MNIFNVIILGIIEGFTEFLPISSTAHLIIASRVLAIADSDFHKSFLIAIQLGAIVSVAVLYFRTICGDMRVLKRVAIAFAPTAVVGFFLYSWIKNVLFESHGLIAWVFIAGGILFLLFERTHDESRERFALAAIPYSRAFLIGLAQALAVVPGVSRAGATVIGGMLLGVEKRAIVEFSFLLAIPTMAAATGYDLFRNGYSFTRGEWYLLAIGFVISFIFAMIGVKSFLALLTHRSFTVFGVYRIAFGLLLVISLLV